MSESIGGRRWLPVLLILLMFFLINVFSIRDKSFTYDEPVHLTYGLQVLRGDSSRFVDGTMPVSALNAIPRVLAEFASPRSLRMMLADPATGRFATILFSMLVCFYVFRWARDLYGYRAGILSMTLYALSPNIIAHSRLVTTDVYGAGMALIALYHFWRLINRKSWRNAVAGALTLGLAQMAKYVCAFLYPAYLLILLVRSAGYASGRATGPRTANTRAAEKPTDGVRATAGYVVLFIVTSLVVVNAGYLFNRTMTRFGEYEWRSTVLTSIQSRLPVLGGVPVPLPYPALEGLDWGQRRTEEGRGLPNVYLLGELRRAGGFKGYYVVAAALKVPLAVQALVLIAAVNYGIRRRRYRFYDDEVFIIVPVLMYAVYFNFFFKMQMGIRHYLVVFPLLHVFCGSLITGAEPVNKRLRIVIGALISYLAVSVASYFPHYIPYFNEIVWDRKKAYKYLADSNVDWGQDTRRVEEYKRAHPDVLVIERVKPWAGGSERATRPALPDSGRIVVNVNQLVGLRDPEQFRWLRENYEPIGSIGYSHIIFEVTPARDEGGDISSP